VILKIYALRCSSIITYFFISDLSFQMNPLFFTAADFFLTKFTAADTNSHLGINHFTRYSFAKFVIWLNAGSNKC
jgi:hypothetical protein